MCDCELNYQQIYSELQFLRDLKIFGDEYISCDFCDAMINDFRDIKKCEKCSKFACYRCNYNSCNNLSNKFKII